MQIYAITEVKDFGLIPLNCPNRCIMLLEVKDMRNPKSLGLIPWQCSFVPYLVNILDHFIYGSKRFCQEQN